MAFDEQAKTKRDPTATKERILRAGLAEFGSKGFGGARTAAIAKRAECNIRMLYHYFGGKQDLYLACLDQIYSGIRAEEQTLNLQILDPVEAIRHLVLFTFDHVRANPDFINIASVENAQNGRMIKKLPHLAGSTSNLFDTIDDILKRGRDAKVLRDGIDATQLYVSIVSMTCLHLTNHHTLSYIYGRDLTDIEWVDTRRDHVCDMVLAYVKIAD